MPLSLKTENIALIKDEKFSCIVERNGENLFAKLERGISPLIDLNDFSPEVLKSSLVYDKIIGRAAAMITINCCASYVYGLVMSRDAYDMLKNAGIEVEYGELVPFIVNRDNTGMCPIEDSVKNITDVSDGVKAIRERVNLLTTHSSI